MTDQENKEQKAKTKKALNNMMELKRDIFMYGSDKVFRSLNSWLLLTNSSDRMAQYVPYLNLNLQCERICAMARN